MRIVITGASGNLGTALLRRLAGGGHDLVGIVRRPPAPGTGAPYGDMTWVALDLTEDRCLPDLRAAFTDANAVVHLAWGFQPSHRLGYLRELGVGGTARVLTSIRTMQVPHLVHVSSVGAYSPARDDTPVTEDYPTEGVPTSPYSQHKAEAERLLDTFEREHPDVTVARMRPGIVGQGTAGSSLLRYGLPAIVPAGMVRALPLLPVDRTLRIPMVHADDVAAAIALELEALVGGAFNLAAPPAITPAHLAAALGARHVHAPARLLRTAVAASWHARLQPLDPGWIDLAFAVPLQDTTRASTELGWAPAHDAVATLRETVAGMADGAHDDTPSMRARTVAGQLARMGAGGPVTRRTRP